MASSFAPSWRTDLRKGTASYDAISDLVPALIHYFDHGDPLVCAKIKRAMKLGAADARPLILKALAR